MSKETGGPAFPESIADFAQHRGMTLRDWLAGMAMQGWLASYGEDARHPSASGHESDVANNAYKLADAMIAARSR